MSWVGFIAFVLLLAVNNRLFYKGIMSRVFWRRCAYWAVSAAV